MRLVLQHGGHELEREDQRFTATLDPRVLDVGMYREQQVRRQRPWRRGPHQEGRVGLPLHSESHVDRRVLDLAIPLRHLVRRQRGTDARVVRHHLVALVQQLLVPQLLQELPHALDVVVVQREIRVLEINPEAHAFRHGFPFGYVAHDRRATLRREARDTDFLLDALLIEDAELFLDLVLHGQSVGVPAGLTRAVETAHRLVAREQVLEGAREHVMDAGPAVRGGRPLVEHELRPRRTFSHEAAKHVLATPEVEGAFLDLRPVIAGADWFEHRCL